MTKGNIYILVGLPASGKSSYIEKNIKPDSQVLSSDAIRKELLGDETIQHSNAQVFSTLFERLFKLQSEKVTNIYIDATSISVADRRKALNAIKRGNKSKLIGRDGNDVQLEKFYKVTGVVLLQDTDTLLRRDTERERTVGEKVIMRMLARFTPPVLEEGFDEIVSIPGEVVKKEKEETFIKALEGFISGTEPIESVLEQDNYLSKSLDCEQTSQWHQETLLEHLQMILEAVEEKVEQKDMRMLRILTLFHDIGKPFVRCKKFENLIRRGYEHIGGQEFKKKNGTVVEIPSYNDYQFLEHENFGANIFVSNYRDLLVAKNIISVQEADILEVIIRGHLDFHANGGKSSIILGGKKYESDSEIFRLGTIFSYCDGKGRISINT